MNTTYAYIFAAGFAIGALFAAFITAMLAGAREYRQPVTDHDGESTPCACWGDQRDQWRGNSVHRP